MLSLVHLLAASLFIQVTFGLLEPISTSIAVGLAAGLGYNFNFFKDNTYCKWKECCNADYIPNNIANLVSALQLNLFGQHIVQQQLVAALSAHLEKDVKSKKSLVLCFHGTTGTGKSYVSEFIAKSLYEKGLESRFVHIYNCQSDFLHGSDMRVNQKQLRDEVQAAMLACPQSLFIFNEVDKAPAGIFDSLTSMLDHHNSVRGADYSQAIFVFLSNMAGVDIGLRLSALMSAGKLREETKLSDFEKIIEEVAYNAGGMKKSSLIEGYVVDHYIPFLPLEKEHIHQCAKAEFRRWNKSPDPEVIDGIIKEHVVFEKTGLFSASGCKTISSKVALNIN